MQAYRGRRLPDQVLPFDQNDGAGFWWPNGLNTLVGNVAAENDHYGFRYDVQKTSRFDPRLPIRTAKGRERVVDIRRNHHLDLRQPGIQTSQIDLAQAGQRRATECQLLSCAIQKAHPKSGEQAGAAIRP